jgi:hypothetical protein
MSKTIAKPVIALFFLSSLFLTSAQNSLIVAQESSPKEQGATVVPEISKYGSLVGLKDANGKNLLKGVPRSWYEGYVIAYQVTNSNGGKENRFFYVLGNQVSPKNPSVDNQKSTSLMKIITTADGVWEITRSFTWDEKSRALESQIKIKNVSDAESILNGIEIITDKRWLEFLVAQRDMAHLFQTLQPQCPPTPIAARMGLCSKGDDCPECGCGDRCYPKPGQARALLRDPMSRWPVGNPNPPDPMPERILLKVPTFCLSWAESNLPITTLKPGEQIEGHYTITISLQK